MYVGMWMTKEVVSIEPTATLDAAAQLMADHKIRRLPVLASANPDSKVIGILSATDVLHAFPPSVNPFAGVPTRDNPTAASPGSHRSVQDVMARNPATIAPDAPIEAAAALLRSRKIGALPVVRSDRLVGMITESDVFRALTQLFDLSTAGARISFDISKDEDVLPFLVETAKKHGLRVTSFVSLRTLERPMCVVHVAGRSIDAMLEDVWQSKHRVTSVLRGAELKA